MKNLGFDLTRYDTRNIHRDHRPDRNGWWLKIQRNGKRLSKYFSDSNYWGSAEVALIAASEARDEFIKRNPKLPFQPTTIASNSTGVNGVSFAKTHGKSGAFVATWQRDDGGKTVREFAVERYGFHEALNKAIEARRSWEEEQRTKIMAETKKPKNKAVRPLHVSE
ncbi:MAG: AP2 domain-containing protein [Caldilineaceae bacterium]|nr:AP2 domain-containing protein [Caldilineaceae bacterium]